MAKANKHPKPKPSHKQAKQLQNKKRVASKQNDVSGLKDQLSVLGLKIIQVTSDGNCFFRALSDQLEGDEDEHEKYRRLVVGYIKNNREMFEPFVEDEVPFDDYCQTMGEDGTWAGHMELQAASLVTHTNICIHRHLSPRWYIQNFDKRDARMIHLSYHDGEHYNSVRSKEDTCSGPAREIVIKGDTELSAKPSQSKASTRKSKEGGAANVAHEESVKLVKAGSGCEDTRKVEQALQKVGGDVDAAVEVMIADQESSDQIVAQDEFSLPEKYSSDEQQDVNMEQRKLQVEDNTQDIDIPGNDMTRNNKPNSLRPDEKNISRNKNCPCGSRKKYKSCCGSVAGKSAIRLTVNQTVDYGKSRKDRKQSRKGGSTVENAIQSNGKPLDMGALCI